MKRYTDAAQSYRQAIKIAKKDNPDRIQSFKFDLAQALYQAKDLEGAEKVYLEMLKEDPGDGGAMVGLARNRRDQKKYEEKLSAFYSELELCEDGNAAKRTVDYLLEKTNVGQHNIPKQRRHRA